MKLYPHDCSYLFTEYWRSKELESYEIEMKKRRLDDGEATQGGRDNYEKIHTRNNGSTIIWAAVSSAKRL